MQLDPDSGRISDARWIASPNFDARPHAAFINTLVVHAISLPPECFGEGFVEDFFCNRLNRAAHPYFETISHLRVSSHFYVRRKGELVQFVATGERAWHAGDSEFRGMERVNDFSIGIELEGCDTRAFEDSQYRTLSLLCRCLIQAYPAIARTRITGHSDIAPGRKTDPGPHFDWQRFLRML